MIKVGFKKLTEGAILPVKAHPTDSGFDLFVNEDVIINQGELHTIKTGIAVQLPAGYEAQVRPRSGITSNTKLRVQLGTVDNDYTGEIGIIVDNINKDSSFMGQYIDQTTDDSIKYRYGAYGIRKGDKLAQLIIAPIPAVDTYEFTEDVETVRGTNGFGSSGY